MVFSDFVVEEDEVVDFPVFFEEDELDTSSVIPFLSMVELRKSVHKNLMKVLKLKMPNLCTSYIPFLADVEKMGLHKKPLANFCPNSKASNSYKSLWIEVKKKSTFVN